MKLTKEKILACLSEIKSELEASGIQKLALFGSFANNQQNVYSDNRYRYTKKLFR